MSTLESPPTLRGQAEERGEGTCPAHVDRPHASGTSCSQPQEVLHREGESGALAGSHVWIVTCTQSPQKVNMGLEVSPHQPDPRQLGCPHPGLRLVLHLHWTNQGFSPGLNSHVQCPLPPSSVQPGPSWTRVSKWEACGESKLPRPVPRRTASMPVSPSQPAAARGWRQDGGGRESMKLVPAPHVPSPHLRFPELLQRASGCSVGSIGREQKHPSGLVLGTPSSSSGFLWTCLWTSWCSSAAALSVWRVGSREQPVCIRPESGVCSGRREALTGQEACATLALLLTAPEQARPSPRCQQGCVSGEGSLACSRPPSQCVFTGH